MFGKWGTFLYFCFFGLLLTAFGLVMIIVLGKRTVLKCTNSEFPRINCVKKTKCLWGIPIGEETIKNVQGATLSVESSEIEDDSIIYLYRVSLYTAQGTVPLSMYTSDKEPKLRMVEKINTYVTNKTKGILEVHGEGAESTCVLILAGFMFCFSGGILIALAILVYFYPNAGNKQVPQ